MGNSHSAPTSVQVLALYERAHAVLDKAERANTSATTLVLIGTALLTTSLLLTVLHYHAFLHKVASAIAIACSQVSQATIGTVKELGTWTTQGVVHGVALSKQVVKDVLDQSHAISAGVVYAFSKPKTDSMSEPKADNKSEPKADNKSEPKANNKSEPKADSKSKRTADSKSKRTATSKTREAGRVGKDVGDGWVAL